MANVEKLVQEWGYLVNRRRLYEPVWIELAEFTQPRKSSIIGTTGYVSPGQSQTDRLLDSTAVHANELLAASMQGSLTSSALKWFGLRLRGVRLAQDHDWMVWLDLVSEIMYDNFRQSNFPSEVHETYLDLGAFGTGCLFMDEADPEPGGGFGGLNFTAIPPGTFAISEDKAGRVNRVFRDVRMSAWAIAEKWPKTVGQCKNVMGALKTDATQEFSIIHAVYPRNDYNPYSKSKKGTAMAWASCWVEPEHKVLLGEGGFQENPYAVPRWAKASGETYGRGPGYTALPDTKTLNKLVELKLRALAKAVNPPLLVRDEGVIGAVRLIPGGLTHVRDMEAVKELVQAGRYDVESMEEEKLQTAIRRVFFSDQLQMQEGPQMTAYEVQVRYELMQRLLGPTLGRLESELLNPVIERCFWIMYRRGQFPPMPKSLKDFLKQNKQSFDIEYEGPLARAQRLAESVAVQRFFQVVLPLAEADEGVLDVVDLDATVKFYAESLAVPARILRSDEQKENLRQARVQAQDEMNERAKMTEQAEAAGKAAPILKALSEGAAQGILPASGAVTSGTTQGGVS